MAPRLVGRDAQTPRLKKRVRIIAQGWERDDGDGHVHTGDLRHRARDSLMFSEEQVAELIVDIDRIAGAFEKIGAALDEHNELERTQPERMQQQMTELFDKLRGMLGGGFPVTPWRSDGIVELSPLQGGPSGPAFPAAPVGPDGT
jgi:hypothetical protein